MAAPFSNMAAQATDNLQPLFVKAAYWAWQLYKLTGGTLPTAPFSNMAPQHNDSLNVLAAKLAYWLEGASTGSGGGGGLQTGAGAPTGATATSPVFYWDTTNLNLYIYANGQWNVH